MKRAFLVMCLLTAGSVMAHAKLMHCFFFTPIAEATDADWKAFGKATDELPKKIPGMTAVTHGKLRRPSAKREHGVCMEFKDASALDGYAKHEAHDAWVKVYEKVRQPGTSTFDIVTE